jgi:NAD(P)H-dependent flavin oxidoreductase YrpB (nitropropane dioxygenase family)
VPPDELRRRIRHVRELTDRPFGVNLWLHTELRPPIDPATIPNNTVDAVQATLNRFRERLGVATTGGRPAQMPDLIDAQFEVILDASAAQGTGDFFPMWAGQSVGLVHDLPGAGTVVRSIAQEAHEVLTALAQRVRP